MNITNVTLKFPSQFSGYINNEKTAQFEGEKFSDFINYLDDTFGYIKERLFDENGELRPYINFYIGKKNIKTLQGLQSEVSNGEKITLLLSRAGG
ncbi:hypothetical protein [Flavivirga jejuensis]|uniref:ThiS family protein n=1 Tax=Flavivirga jejuensis TaxID=870487 RepID=A0ABT8WNA0_9FLAO|nr:hypothetical protein [Flavivirga jejuensis]MDO5974412.1 hypothetical protein [Flavivirga jejuensis]